MKEVVNKLIPDSTGKDIEKACPSIYPLHDVFVRKVKMLNKHHLNRCTFLDFQGRVQGGAENLGALRYYLKP